MTFRLWRCFFSIVPVPYLELFWAGPVKKLTMYVRSSIRRLYMSNGSSSFHMWPLHVQPILAAESNTGKDKDKDNIYNVLQGV